MPFSPEAGRRESDFAERWASGFLHRLAADFSGKMGIRMSEKFEEAIRRFDEENSRDPHRDEVDGALHPRELLYAQRLTDWVKRLAPQASETLLLAARCQHLCRWEIPRSSYEMTRAGYLRWRAELKEFHAGKSAGILRAVGYDEDVIAQVQDLNRKKNLGRDPDCQTLEDALCLVTLQYQLADLVAKTEREKMIGILQKTWKKMSEAARAEALKLAYSPAERDLLQAALS
jgi:hypothetical protein